MPREPRRANWTAFGARSPFAGTLPSVREFTAADFDVLFQPVVSTRDGSVVGQEMFARCLRPEYPYTPDLFKKAAEEHACGYIGRVIRDVAFDKGIQAALFINVHPDELAARWLVRPDDPMCFHEYPVYLEVTEAAAFAHFELCMRVIGDVRERIGARLVVDDFGAEHSGLQRVFQLNPSFVKLNASLVRAADTDARRAVALAHLIRLCHDLGAQVVVKGIESPAHLHIALEAGADAVQGHFLAEPSPVPQPVNWPAPRAPAPTAPLAGEGPTDEGARRTVTRRASTAVDGTRLGTATTEPAPSRPSDPAGAPDPEHRRTDAPRAGRKDRRTR